jgi:hypothetical protein
MVEVPRVKSYRGFVFASEAADGRSLEDFLGRGNAGLGYFLSFGEGQANTPMVFVSILMLTLVGSVAYVAVILVERRVLHYQPTRTRATLQ